MALGASVSKSKCQITNSRFHRQKSPSSSGNGHVENSALEDPSEQVNSSDEDSEVRYLISNMHRDNEV